MVGGEGGEEGGGVGGGQNRALEGVQPLPVGWDSVVVPPPGRNYLWSPALNSEGKEVKRVKVFSFGQVQGLQGPSPKFPHGRFQEIEKRHFT